MKVIFYSFILLSFVISCASRPKLYPNHKVRAVGKVASEGDIDRCMADSEEYLESGAGKQIAKGAGKGAAVGAAVGAVSGLLTGNFGRGLLGGAAIGGAAGGAGAAVSPDQIKRSYVNKCLADQGYHVMGWD